MICLKDVSKIYNQGKANETQALQHVTLTIKKGDMVAIAVYEVLRQQNFNNLSFTEIQKGEDYLFK